MRRCTNSDLFLGLIDCLSTEIGKFDIFYKSEIGIVRQHIATLHEVCDFDTGTSQEYIFQLAEPHELENIDHVCSEAQKSLKKLRQYVKLNRAAVDRIFAKVSNFAKPISQSKLDGIGWPNRRIQYETDCALLQDVLESMTSGARKALRLWITQPGPVSSKLDKLYWRDFPEAIRMKAYAIVATDDRSSLANIIDQVLQEDTEYEKSRALSALRGLLRACIAFKAERCATVLTSSKLPNQLNIINDSTVRQLLAQSIRNHDTISEYRAKLDAPACSS